MAREVRLPVCENPRPTEEPLCPAQTSVAILIPHSLPIPSMQKKMTIWVKSPKATPILNRVTSCETLASATSFRNSTRPDQVSAAPCGEAP